MMIDFDGDDDDREQRKVDINGQRKKSKVKYIKDNKKQKKTPPKDEG